MERVQKKEEQKADRGMGAMQMAKVMGNQGAILQMRGTDSSDDERDPAYEWGSEDERQIQEDLMIPEESYRWRDFYGGFIKRKYEAFKNANYNHGCAYDNCLNDSSRGFIEGDPQWKFSIDHKRSVADHYYCGGLQQTYQARHEWYNDESNWQPMHLACNASKSR